MTLSRTAASNRLSAKGLQQGGQRDGLGRHSANEPLEPAYSSPTFQATAFRHGACVHPQAAARLPSVRFRTRSCLDMPVLGGRRRSNQAFAFLLPWVATIVISTIVISTIAISTIAVSTIVVSTIVVRMIAPVRERLRGT
jgi:hypothetical protein